MQTLNNKAKKFCGKSFVIDALARQVALLYVSLFSIQLVLCCLKTLFLSSNPYCVYSAGHPKIKINMTLSRVQHNSTIMHNAQKKKIITFIPFSAPTKIAFCNFFLVFILTKKKCKQSEGLEYTKKSISILKNTVLNTVWMKWIKKIHRLSHVASNMQQTRAGFAFRLKHFEWLKQKTENI